jgi:hypothetical protein
VCSKTGHAGGVEEDRRTAADTLDAGARGVKETAGDARDMQEVVTSESIAGSREEVVWEARRRCVGRGRSETSESTTASCLSCGAGRKTHATQVNASETGRDRGGAGEIEKPS